MKEFVPKKSLTVYLPVEVLKQLEELCEKYGKSKSQMLNDIINTAWYEDR